MFEEADVSLCSTYQKINAERIVAAEVCDATGDAMKYKSSLMKIKTSNVLQLHRY